MFYRQSLKIVKTSEIKNLPSQIAGDFLLKHSGAFCMPEQEYLA
jgi:hypothetical protein